MYQITSDYGKYNTNNFDTIFSKNVIINYIDNKITGEYLDFSMKKTMIISRNVIYTNLRKYFKSRCNRNGYKNERYKNFYV